MTTQSLDLNLIPKGISPRLYVSQYDKGQTWTFNIYAGNTAYTIPNGATVTIQGTKPDKTGFQYSCTASGNVVTATEQQQMTVIAGEVPAEIRITNNNEIIATLNFILVVEPAALTDETEISETDLPIIEQAIEMFPHYQEMIDEVSSDIATLSNVRAELGAHNLFDLKTQAPTVEASGVTFVTNANKTVTANGQSTATSGQTSRINTISSILKAGSYIFSAGLPATGSDTTYHCFLYDLTNSRRIATVYADEDVAFTVNSDIKITVYMSVYSGYTANNIVYKPMIRDARDTDKAFAPFSKPNTELTKDDSGLTANAFENGCVNLLENKATSAVQAGITFVVNADKTISVSATVPANGGTTFIIHDSDTFSHLIGKRVKLSGCPKITGLATRLTAYRVESADGSSGSVFDTGDGVTFDFLNNGTGTKAKFYLEIANNTASPVSINTVYKPMITVADMPNSDYAHYVPYAKSNKELTEDVEDLSNAQYFDFTTETSVQVNTSAQPMTYTIANDGTYRVSLTSKDVDAQNGATLLINGITIGTVRADIIENNVSCILKLKKGTVITNTNSGTARYRMDVIKLS